MQKRYNTGDIVYWCHQHGHKYEVHFGRVAEQFWDAVCIDYLHGKENRLINGIPFNEFESETRYRKLPKGWDYNTKLFELTTEKNEQSINIKKPSEIIEAYNKGILVKDIEISQAVIEAEVDKNKEYRIIKRYPQWQYHVSRVSLRPDRIYLTYEEAQKEVDENILEFYRQANLSEYDWSVEQIDKALNIWAALRGINNETKVKYRDWILSLENVENIETRISSGEIQWKYYNRIRWNNIEIQI